MEILFRVSGRSPSATADGYIARSSLAQLTRSSGDSSQTSDVPLPGGVVTVDVVENPRSGERALIGGSDDGTIAMWTYEYVHCLFASLALVA